MIKQIEDTNWKVTLSNSALVSWSYTKDGEGLVLIGVRDPLGIDERMEIRTVATNEDGIDILKAMGISIL